VRHHSYCYDRCPTLQKGKFLQDTLENFSKILNILDGVEIISGKGVFSALFGFPGFKKNFEGERGGFLFSGSGTVVLLKLYYLCRYSAVHLRDF